MKKIFNIVSALMIAVFALSSAGTAFALTLNNGQAASMVLGQPNFISNGCHVTQTGMCGPEGIAVDPTTGKIFISDAKANRVLRFASVASLSNGAAAEAVLGQPNFTSNGIATSQSGMNGPEGLVVDSAGRLWVADSGNSRILRFNNASTKTNGALADAVLGQPNFTSKTSKTTQSGMYFPEAVATDSAGHLWVVDSFNSRVLRFNNAAAKLNGANADGVLGQLNFTASIHATTQKGMNYPSGLAIDSTGRVWVADWNNCRVLRFNNAAAKLNGANADGVLGQLNFTSKACVATQNGIAGPGLMTLDSSGRLWVTDFNNSRILGFANAASLGNGANASVVLGQANFTSKVWATSAAGMAGPSGVFYDPKADVLWTTDWNNIRAMQYGLATLSQNGGFNSYVGASKIPTSWVAVNFAATDGKDTTIKQEGAASVKISGAPAKIKTLTQTLTMNGKSGSKFTFSFWERGSAIPLAGSCEAQVLFYNGTTLLTSQTQTTPCADGTHTTFQNNTSSFTVTANYTKAVIKFTYGKASGTIWFDAVSLMK